MFEPPPSKFKDEEDVTGLTLPDIFTVPCRGLALPDIFTFPCKGTDSIGTEALVLSMGNPGDSWTAS
eukprot:jgi/Botrbrau1/17220/Bobra.0799s0003.1